MKPQMRADTCRCCPGDPEWDRGGAHALRNGRRSSASARSTISNQQSSKVSGFTLLELLLALSVSATIAAALSTTLYTAFRARAAAERAIASTRSLEVIGDVVAADLGSALPPTGFLANAFFGDATSLDFYCGGGEYGAALQGGIRRVQYSLGQAEPTSLVRRVTSNLMAPVETEAPEERVCGGVEELKLEYYDGAGWLEAWDSTQHSDTLPVAVRVTLWLTAEQSHSADNSISRIIPIPCGVSEETLARATEGAGQ